MIVNRQRRVPMAIQPLQNFYERVRCELQFPPESRWLLARTRTVHFIS